jgi:hypothetical protein
MSFNILLDEVEKILYTLEILNEWHSIPEKEIQTFQKLYDDNGHILKSKIEIIKSEFVTHENFTEEKFVRIKKIFSKLKTLYGLHEKIIREFGERPKKSFENSHERDVFYHIMHSFKKEKFDWYDEFLLKHSEKFPNLNRPEMHPSGQLQSFIDMLNYANPDYASVQDLSCVKYYDCLSQNLATFELEFSLELARIPNANLTIYRDAYLKKVVSQIKEYGGFNYEDATKYLKENYLTLDKMFQLWKSELTKEGLPNFINYSHFEILRLFSSDNMLNLHWAFITLISDHFINKLRAAIKGSEIANQQEKIVVEKEYIAFTLKQYQAKKPRLTLLLNFLKEKEFIAKSDIKDFRLIFQNQNPSKLIVWIGGIASLSYFVKLLHTEYELIETFAKKEGIWNVTSQLFIDQGGGYFEAKKLTWQKTPSKKIKDMLETAVNYLIPNEKSL